MRVELPQATPDVYLRWAARWRELDRAARTKEASLLRRHPPALQTLVGSYVSAQLIPQVQGQAWSARRDGLAFVAPSVEGEDELLRLSLDALARRGRWLAWGAEQERAGAASGVAPPEIELRVLQHRLVERLRGQLYGVAKEDETFLAGATFCPSCGSTDVVVLATTVHGSSLSITACNQCDATPWTSGEADAETERLVHSTGKVRPGAS